MKNGHTKGLWKLNRSLAEERRRYWVDTEDGCIELIGPNRAENARLVAAAPDLLEALQEALMDLEQFKVADDVCNEHPVITKARDAIARATGRAVA